MGAKLHAVDYIALTLLVIGGLNWGLIGLYQYDLVATLFGAMSNLSRAVYGLVGVAAVYTVYIIYKLAYRRS